jgi:hypothetical protein
MTSSKKHYSGGVMETRSKTQKRKRDDDARAKIHIIEITSEISRGPRDIGTYTGTTNLERRYRDLREGIGKMEYVNGDEYIGNWYRNERLGKGTMKYINGDIFVGQWNDEIVNGVMTYSNNGGQYDGDFQDQNDEDFEKFSYREGDGIMTYSNGDKYNGRWLNDKREGEGDITYTNGDKYNGRWVEDKRQGEGSMTYGDGTPSFTGIWINDRIKTNAEIERDLEIERLALQRRERANDNMIRQPEVDAVEIHKVAGKINIEKFFKLINIDKDFSYDTDVVENLQNKIVNYINNDETKTDIKFKEVKDKSINQLNKFLDKLKLSTYSHEPLSRNIMGKSMTFVFMQDKSFIDNYVQVFIQDNYFAYDVLQHFDGNETTFVAESLSCVAGIIERFYLSIGETLKNMCIGIGTDNEDCHEGTKYDELSKFFRNIININEFTQAWEKQSKDASDNWITELKWDNEKTREENIKRRQSNYIAFVQKQYELVDAWDPEIQKQIVIEAAKFDWVYKNEDFLLFGGKGKKKRKTLKRKSSKRKTLKRKSSKRKTLKRKSSKRKTSMRKMKRIKKTTHKKR